MWRSQAQRGGANGSSDQWNRDNNARGAYRADGGYGTAEGSEYGWNQRDGRQQDGWDRGDGVSGYPPEPRQPNYRSEDFSRARDGYSGRHGGPSGEAHNQGYRYAGAQEGYEGHGAMQTEGQWNQPLSSYQLDGWSHRGPSQYNNNNSWNVGDRYDNNHHHRYNTRSHHYAPQPLDHQPAPPPPASEPSGRYLTPRQRKAQPNQSREIHTRSYVQREHEEATSRQAHSRELISGLNGTSQYPDRPRPRSRSRTPFSPGADPDSGVSTPRISGGKKKVRPHFDPFLPSSEYIAISHPSYAFRPSYGNRPPEPRTKLLVLDLNGALIYRSQGSQRHSYPRPYLGNFLEYVFTPEPATVAPGAAGEKKGRTNPSGKHDLPFRPWEAFVWSSAQPHNVRKMVETTFGEKWVQGVWSEEGVIEQDERRRRGEGRLLGVWARDKMRLSEEHYNKHVQTVKDLRDLHNGLLQPENLPPSSDMQFYRYDFDETNIVLIDDSPLKAVHQPWNHICVPEYDTPEHSDSKTAAQELSRDPAEGPVEGMDEYLLCVIGILEAMRSVDSVPAWIRGGGLSIEGHKAEDEVEEPTLETLPSHTTFKQWYQDTQVVEYWREKGVAALRRKGIPVQHGVDTTKDSSASSRFYNREISGRSGEAGTLSSRSAQGSEPSGPSIQDQHSTSTRQLAVSSRARATPRTEALASLMSQTRITSDGDTPDAGSDEPLPS